MMGNFAIAQLIWTERNGAGRLVQGNAAILAKRLETLRRPATLKLLDGTIIGGCEPANGSADDRRIKWHWWYDKSALQTGEPIEKVRSVLP